MPRNSAFGRPLSERQVEVLSTFAQAGSTREAAKLLFLSEKTVKNTLSSLYAQLGVAHGVTAVWKVFVEQSEKSVGNSD